MKVNDISPRKRVKIVFEGLENDPVKVCDKYGISREKFEEWKAKLLESAKAVFNSELNQEAVDRAIRRAVRSANLISRIKN